MLRQRLTTILYALVLLPFMALATHVMASETVSLSELTQIEPVATSQVVSLVSDYSEAIKEISEDGAGINNHCSDNNVSHQCGGCATCAIPPLDPKNISTAGTDDITPYQVQFSFIVINNPFKPPRV